MASWPWWEPQLWLFIHLTPSRDLTCKHMGISPTQFGNHVLKPLSWNTTHMYYFCHDCSYSITYCCSTSSYLLYVTVIIVIILVYIYLTQRSCFVEGTLTDVSKVEWTYDHIFVCSLSSRRNNKKLHSHTASWFLSFFFFFYLLW